MKLLHFPILLFCFLMIACSNDKPQKEIKISKNNSEKNKAIPFTSGKIARFIIPVDATEDDLLLLHDMFDVLLKRKFKLDI